MTICELSFRRRRSFHIWQIEKAELRGGSSRKKKPNQPWGSLAWPIELLRAEKGGETDAQTHSRIREEGKEKWVPTL